MPYCYQTASDFIESYYNEYVRFSAFSSLDVEKNIKLLIFNGDKEMKGMKNLLRVRDQHFILILCSNVSNLLKRCDMKCEMNLDYE